MKQPEKLIYSCPMGCEDEVDLSLVGVEFTIRNKRYTGEQWVYECTSCGERFTTAESDNITIEGLHIEDIQ